MNRQDLPSLPIGVSQKVTFDFTSLLAVGETISTQAVVSTVYSGTDATPSSLVSGSATASGAVVTQLLATTGRTAGATYSLICTITTSASQTLQLAAYQTLVAQLT